MNINNIMKLIIKANISWTHAMSVTHVCALRVLSHVLFTQQSNKGIVSLLRFYRSEN